MNTDFFFPPFVVDIDGNNVNIKELASHHVLILITLKATWCPVCPKLLMLLNLQGLHDDPPPSFFDPFDNSIIKVPQKNIPFNRLLLRSDAYFIIICPGPLDEVKKIRRECNFDKYPYPFIVDEDLSLATSIGLRMSNNEIWPCIGYIKPLTCGLIPIFFGRGPGFYGDKDLLNFLKEHRIQEEKTALKSIRRARELQTGLSKSRKNNIIKKKESKELEISKAPIEEEQKEELFTMSNQNQILPLEILGVIFEYLDSLEIVKTVMATCQQWREIGINIISRRLRCEIERISESLICFPGTNRKNNDDDDNVEVIVESMNLININIHNYNNNNNIKLISVHELNKMVRNLHEIIEISQRLLIYCDYKQKLY